jgi:hypothetical protein
MKRGSANAILLPAVVVALVAIAAALLYVQRKHNSEQAALEAEYSRLNSWHDPAKRAYEKILPDIDALSKYDWRRAPDSREIDSLLKRISDGAAEIKRSAGPQGAGHALPERVDQLVRQSSRLGRDMELQFKLSDPASRAHLATYVWDQLPEAQHHKMTTPTENFAWRDSLVQKAMKLDDATLQKMYLRSDIVDEGKQYYQDLGGRDDVDRLFRIPPIVPPGLERKDADQWR